MTAVRERWLGLRHSLYTPVLFVTHIHDITLCRRTSRRRRQFNVCFRETFEDTFGFHGK